MEERVRSKETSVIGGNVYTVADGVIYTQHYIPRAQYMTDFWRKKTRSDGSLPASNLVYRIIERYPLTMNRTTGTFRFDKCEFFEDRTPSLPTFYHSTGSLARATENTLLTAELLERTHPWRPEFSIPVFIKELVEIASLFYIAGESLARFAGSTYLNYKFGWKAFMADLKTLSGITATIESRVKELQSLTKPGGARRLVPLGVARESATTVNTVLNSIYATTIRGDIIASRQIKYSGSVRWRALPGFDHGMTKLEAFNKAVRLAFDIEGIDAHTLWGMVPFSWLVDYFVDISAYLQGSQGRVELEPYDICIMRLVECNESLRVTSKPSNVSISGSGRYVLTGKQRDVWHRGSFPSVRTGLLSQGQILTLAALLARFSSVK